MEYTRTYCITIRIHKGNVEDCLKYDSDEVYNYIYLTHCDADNDYLIVGGCDITKSARRTRLGKHIPSQ